jgi:hypothetical protein
MVPSVAGAMAEFQEAVTVVRTEYLTATVSPPPLHRLVTATEAKNLGGMAEEAVILAEEALIREVLLGIKAELLQAASLLQQEYTAVLRLEVPMVAVSWGTAGMGTTGPTETRAGDSAGAQALAAAVEWGSLESHPVPPQSRCEACLGDAQPTKSPSSFADMRWRRATQFTWAWLPMGVSRARLG